MDYSKSELLKVLNCSSSTLYLYLDRLEFSNIVKKNKIENKKNSIYYSNVTEENIKRFRELTKRKRCTYYV